MNLERLYIENYKQLREPLELYPPEGAVGVIGANGTGKSTLFESILWAFFGSRGRDPRFANESIPWSGGSTKDPTVVEVTLSTENGPYTVRRQLRSNSTGAEARDPEGRTLVTGTTDVTRWVEQHLLRMDRTAFEATFYARQKELKFFAHHDGVERVRRVSEMLGISGVKKAQKLLREDRKELRSEANLLEARLAEADLEGLRRELNEARSDLNRIEGELAKVGGELEETTEALKVAREARDALAAGYREHTRLNRELQRAEGERVRAEDRARAAEETLKELAHDREDLSRLRSELERLPALEAELERLEEAKRRVERRDQVRRELLQAQARITAIESEVWDTLEDLDGADEEPLAGWNALFDLDGTELLAGAASVLKEADRQLKLAEERHERLKQLAADHEDLRLTEKDVREAEERHREALAETRRLAAELEDVSGGEDLEVWERELRGEEEKLREIAANHRGRAAAHEREAKNIDKAREAIESGAEEHCPTCHRGFEEGEQLEISDTLRRQAAALRRLAARDAEEAEKLSESAAATAKKLAKVSERLARWRELREALLRAEDRAADRLEALERTREHHRELRARLDGSPVPTAEELAAAEAHRERLRELRDARPGVASLAREHAELTRKTSELAKELEDLSGVAYDPKAHRERREETSRLTAERGRAVEIEKRLARRPEIEASLVEARRRGRKAGEEAARLRGEISALAFDEAAYEAAGERITAAEERAAVLRDAREQLGGEWKDAEYRIERAKGELRRLEDDRRLANMKTSEAARMDEMDALFTRFLGSLTARARPMLEAEASALVRELTDGRYERMEFDENYRVKLLDRFDDSYPIDRFSGGEADIASLSARMALSKLIAAGGGGSLGFLVLDEVFGSLDAGRRNNVLLALERLKRSFGQIFIISHVGEVQESALVDEVWMLEEDEEGKSTVRRVERGSDREITADLRGSLAR
ncbi:MAG: SMC family ATPase [Actinomycetota bacterium]